jgi:hypothetical protein
MGATSPGYRIRYEYFVDGLTYKFLSLGVIRSSHTISIFYQQMEVGKSIL